MGKDSLVIGDSDALISIFHCEDANHEKTKGLLKILIAKEIEIVFPAAIISEAITTNMQKRFREKNPRLSQMLVKQLTSDIITTVPTDADILQRAASVFDPRASKKHTFFDAIVLATAKQYQALAIFSYDQWYKEQNFQRVIDLEM